MSVSEFKNVVRKARRTVLRTVSSVAASSLEMEYRNLVVIAPHPDDEVFGCAGLISSAIANGCEVSVLYLSTGGGSHRNCCNVSEHDVGINRRLVATKVAESMGIKLERCLFLEGTDGNLPCSEHEHFVDFADSIQKKLIYLKPDAVFCPHPFDGWPDHIAAVELTRAAIGGLSYRTSLYYYCVWFWFNMPLRRVCYMNWRRARVLDIRGNFCLKKRAMQIYLDFLAPCGNPWIGKLPKELLRAFDWKKELFFKAEY